MDADDVKRLAKNPDFIPGIYSYCDRWCERCRFTHRCMNYAMQELEGVAEKKVGLKKSLKIVQNSFGVAIELLHEMMRKHGIDPEEVHKEARAEAARKPEPLLGELSLKLPHLRQSYKYALFVRDWFKSRARDFQSRGIDLSKALMIGTLSEDQAESELARLRDAVDVIYWYQLFIHVKLSRAAHQLDDDDDHDDPDTLEAAQDDAKGSAKVALIGIDNSLQAWQILRGHFPRRARDIDRTRASLNRLRKSVEKIYPNARAFQRPGFDYMPKKRKR